MADGAWDAAYRGLTARAARLYRLLAGHPAAHFPPEAAAAALGEGQRAADDAVDELETANLLQIRLDGHLHLHDLLRAHARRCARRDGDPARGRAAARRVVRWYRRQAERADRLAAGPRLRLAEPVPPLPYAPDVPLADGPAARRWLARERQPLFGSVRLARDHGLDTDAWALCEPLWTHYLDHGPCAEALAAFRTGVTAAGRAGQPAARARLRCQAARALWELGRPAEARGEVAAALRAVRTLRDADPRLLPTVVECGGRLRAAEGDWRGAAVAFARARRLHEAIGDAYGELLLTHLLGRAAARLGEPERAAALLERAHAMALAQGRDRLIGRTAHELGLTLAELGDARRAVALLRTALANALRRGSERDEAAAGQALAKLTRDGRDGRDG